MLSITIETGNAAFGDADDAEGPAAGYECAAILRSIADRLEAGETDGKLRDSNGNTVGSFELTED